VLGYRDLEQKFGSDLDGYIGDRFTWVDGTGLEQDQTSLEVRWAGQLSDKVSLTTGIHLFNQEYTYSERRLLSNIFDRRGRSNIDHTTASLFAQSDIKLLEPLVLTLGGRYTTESKDAKIGIIGDPAATGGCRTVDIRNEPPGTTFDSLDATTNLDDCKQPFKDKHHWSNFSPKVGLSWHIKDDLLAYASYTKGFRSGGYNVRFTSANPLTTPGPYNEEVVNAYELGFKSTLADGKFRLNVALFNNSFDDLQRTVLDSSGTQATLNAATATIKGAEIETVLLLLKNLVIEGSFGWTDATYDSFAEVTRATGRPADSFKFVMTPKTNSSVALTYTTTLGDLGSLDTRVGYSFVDDTFANDTNTAPIGQYELWDASLTFTNTQDNLILSLYGRNLKDEVYSSFGTDFASSSIGVKSNWLTPPRTYGVQATYKF
jgi:iron complex outermembrane receptor protein